MSDRIENQLDKDFEQAADAIINGNLGRLKTVIQQHPSLINARSSNEHHSSLLFYVAANCVETERQKTPDNILDITRFLLDQGADPNVLSDAYGGGSSLLGAVVSSSHPAHANKQADLVKLLCDYGAQVDIENNAPLKTAIAFRYPLAVNALIDCGAPIDSVVFAAAIGDVKQVQEFINAGVKPFITAFREELSDPKHVLEFALTAASMMGQLETVAFLLTQDIDLNAKRTSEKGTALHEASIRGQAEVADLLLKHGADIASGDYQQFSPLHLAAWHQQMETMDVLLRYHPPLEALNSYGGTVLDSTVYGFVHAHYPAENPLATLQKLIDAGADVNKVTPYPTGHEVIDRLLNRYR